MSPAWASVVCSLLSTVGLVIVAWLGGRRLGHVQELVNSNHSALVAKNEELRLELRTEREPLPPGAGGARAQRARLELERAPWETDEDVRAQR